MKNDKTKGINLLTTKYRIAVVTSIHPDFDSRIWKHSTSLVDAGCEVHLVCSWDVRNGELIKGVRLHSFPKVTRRFFRPVAIPIRVLGRLLPILRKVDLVHFHDLDLLPWMIIVSLVKPVIYDIHENYPEEMLLKDWIPKPIRLPLYYIVRWCQRWLSKIIHNIVLVTPSQEAQFKHLGLHIFHLRNYATLSLMADATNDYMQRADTVVFVGSGYESNGTLLILEIATLTKPIYPNVKFLLPDRFASVMFRDTFMRRREEKGLNETVFLFPNMPPHHLMLILNQSTIAIAPNLRVPKQEMAIPTKLFEYMAAGLPIVSSDLPYQRELFSKHCIGILAQPEEPESFVRAIKTLVESRTLACELGKNGQGAFVAEYCWESQVPDLLAFYATIIGC